MTPALPLAPRPDSLPFGEMSWERFEAFAHDLIARLPSYTRCHRQGTRGQKQHGIDLFADDLTGKRWGFSNKRYREYQPHHVRDHIAETTFTADRFVILLSRVASPDVRKEVDLHPGWELWDRDDLSQRVRELAVANPDSARRLVDHHFGPLWRREFLGLPAVAAFLTPHDYFRVWLDTRNLFHHAYALVGRTDHLNRLIDFALSGTAQAGVLVGRGGIGKSRLLHAFTRRVEDEGAEPALRVLVEGVQLTQDGLDELPAGSCVVVVDDAHRCDGLGLLLTYARRRTNLRVLLATRPHGLDRIRGECTRAGFDLRQITHLPDLNPLGRDEVRELARAALGAELSGDYALVDRLARVTGDCPLATVIGGQLLATNAIAPELLAQDETFRRAVFDRFGDERLGRLGSEVSPDLARRVLEVLSAITPVPAEHNEGILSRVADCLRADHIEVARVVGELERLEILIRRGRYLRVTPDVFADHLLASACLTPQNRPTGFAERVFEVFRDVGAAQVLRNLAELDWRARSTSQDETWLLDGLWTSLETAFRDGDNVTRNRVLDLVREAAHYQPRRVLALVRMAIQQPVVAEEPEDEFAPRGPNTTQLAELLERCSYTTDTLPECLALLWHLTASGAPDAHPVSAPLKVLTELAKYEYDKPVWVNRAVVSAVQGWALTATAPATVRALIQIIDPMLAKSCMDVRSDGRRIYQRSFLVSPERVREVRLAALCVLRRFLESTEIGSRLDAIDSYGEALNGPAPYAGIELDTDEYRQMLTEWVPDQLEILDALAHFLSRGQPTVVQLRVLDAIRFQAHFGNQPPVRERARGVAALAEDTFEVQLARLLLTGRFGNEDIDDVRADGPLDWEEAQRRKQQRHVAMAAALWDQFPTAAALVAFLSESVLNLRVFETQVDPGHIIWYLLEARPDMAHDFAAQLVGPTDSPLVPALATCLVHLRRLDGNAATALALAALESGRPMAVHAVAQHYCWNWPGSPFGADDTEVVRRLLGDADPDIRVRSLGALHHLAKTEPRRAVEMSLTVDVAGNKDVADELARITEPTQPAHLTGFGAEELRVLLDKFAPVGRLGHWVCELLRRMVSSAPDEALGFFLRRVYAMDVSDPKPEFEALPFMETRRVFEPLRDTGRELNLSRRVRDQFLAGGHWGRYTLPRLFRAVSVNYSASALVAVREWLDSEDSVYVVSAIDLLQEAGPTFFFDHLDLVAHALNRAELLGADCLGRVERGLYRIAMRYGREGVVGQPYPQDVALRDRAAAALATLSPGTSLHRLVSNLHREGERSIRATEQEIEEGD